MQKFLLFVVVIAAIAAFTQAKELKERTTPTSPTNILRLENNKSTVVHTNQAIILNKILVNETIKIPKNHQYQKLNNDKTTKKVNTAAEGERKKIPTSNEDKLLLGSPNSRHKPSITVITQKKLNDSLHHFKLNNLMKNLRRPNSLNDFTGELLAVEDGGIVTEIQQKFNVSELSTKTLDHGSLERLDSAIAKIFVAAATKEGLAALTVKDKRVKKSFHLPNNYEVGKGMRVDSKHEKTKNLYENVTAKQYELHNETNSDRKLTFNLKDNFNNGKQLVEQLTTSTTSTPKIRITTDAQLFQTYLKERLPDSTTIKTTNSSSTELQDTLSASTLQIIGTTETLKETMDFQNVDKVKPTLTNINMMHVSKNVLPTSNLYTASTPLSWEFESNPTNSSLKPISRPRTLSQLQLKINTLDCEIISIPPNAHLWRGNETHELLLPVMIANNNTEDSIVSWDGNAEIQSGDILIVEINDTLLNPHHKSNVISSHNTQVYQVTRSGYEHCDVTEGVLLDITPLVVDERKLITLYDKDLTEGVNLLIVVSELWGAQCVRLKVSTKIDNCGDNADCSGKGVCYSSSSMEEYECLCCTGFVGPHCEEIDACKPSPCTNNGICVDLSQGHEGNSYQCLCPYGYIGKNCQYEADPCNSAECLNGGTCLGNATHFRCDCAEGFKGPLCQHSLNECESSPCLHGICVDQEDGFRCFCQPGFAGDLCNFEYNECESSPCQNGGKCIDHIGKYECHCTKGFTGNRCQIKVDFCANSICPEGHHCIDHGNEFSCECPNGWNGVNCTQMFRTNCIKNPCSHGGTCWSSGESFYCACRPGYTGTLCEDEFVVETVISSSEFIVDDTSARLFDDRGLPSNKARGSSIEFHSLYLSIGVLTSAIFIVALVVTLCHCKVNQTYRKFSTRSTSFFPILGFGRRTKTQIKLNKHWLSDKNMSTRATSLRANAGLTTLRTHLHGPSSAQNQDRQPKSIANLQERPFQRHLAMNLENDMYYTIDFGENSQASPLIK